MPLRPLRHFEDLAIGERRESRFLTVHTKDMIEFAERYDPQWFHTDPHSARDSMFGEIVASGIYLLALWRMLDHEINGDIDFVCGIGWDEFRIKKAIRGGDTIKVMSEIRDLRLSSTRPDRGVANTHYKMVDKSGDEVLHFTSINLVYTRNRSSIHSI